MTIENNNGLCAETLCYNAHAKNSRYCKKHQWKEVRP